MEIVLTGNSITGSELFQAGVINNAVPREQVILEALKLASKIAAMSRPVVRIGKQAVLTAENMNLEGGMAIEKTLYYSTFDLADCREGITAFLEKRAPEYRHE